MFTLAAPHWETSKLDTSAVPHMFLTKLDSSRGKYEDWLKTSRYYFSQGIFLARNIPHKFLIPCEEIFVRGFGLKPHKEYSSREIFLTRYWANSSYFPHEERISTYKIIVIWVFLWELTLVGFHSISSYFPHEFIMRNFMRISRTGFGIDLPWTA